MRHRLVVARVFFVSLFFCNHRSFLFFTPNGNACCSSFAYAGLNQEGKDANSRKGLLLNTISQCGVRLSVVLAHLSALRHAVRRRELIGITQHYSVQPITPT